MIEKVIHKFMQNLLKEKKTIVTLLKILHGNTGEAIKISLGLLGPYPVSPSLA
jgi:hypothetical protein